MRKRVSRPPRFAAVDNRAIDSLPSILSVGLLTRLIRARDGDEVTVESLAKDYSEGESALGKAMRTLVDRGLVVKFKVQRAATETLVDEETGERSVKRGGSWYTTFTVDSIPHSVDDVADMLDDILAGGNVKAIRVEPTRLDPRKDTPRPTPQNAGVGPTCENAVSAPPPDTQNPRNQAPRPTPQEPGAGRPTPGQAGALYRKKTVVEDSLSSAPEPLPSQEMRGSSAAREEVLELAVDEDEVAPEPSPEVVDFVKALPGEPGKQTVPLLAAKVAVAVADGWTLLALGHHLATRYDPTKVRSPRAVYCQLLDDLPTPPASRLPAQSRHGTTEVADLPPYCGDLDCDEVTRMVCTEDDQGLPQIEPCPRCHPACTRKPAPAAP